MKPILPRALAALALCLSPLAASGQEQAFANRATELRERAAADARAIAPLAEGAEVKVLERAGGWTRVDASGRQGWVRVFHLRFPVVVQQAPAGSSGGALSAVTSIFGGGRETAKSTTIATTGIRGLTPEELKNAQPDAEALQRLQSFRAAPPEAERFARDGRLQKTDARIEGGGA